MKIYLKRTRKESREYKKFLKSLTPVSKIKVGQVAFFYPHDYGKRDQSHAAWLGTIKTGEDGKPVSKYRQFFSQGEGKLIVTAINKTHIEAMAFEKNEWNYGNGYLIPKKCLFSTYEPQS